jgi:hypothetical protein
MMMHEIMMKHKKIEEQTNLKRGFFWAITPSLAASAYGEATLAHFCHRPFTYIIVPENLSEGGAQR